MAIGLAVLLLSLLLAVPAFAVTNTLGWQDNSNNEDGFEIYRSINGSPFELIAIVPANLETWSEDIGPTTFAMNVCYNLDAFNEHGASVRTITLCKTIPAAKGCKPWQGTGISSRILKCSN